MKLKSFNLIFLLIFFFNLFSKENIFKKIITNDEKYALEIAFLFVLLENSGIEINKDNLKIYIKKIEINNNNFLKKIKKGFKNKYLKPIFISKINANYENEYEDIIKNIIKKSNSSWSFFKKNNSFVDIFGNFLIKYKELIKNLYKDSKDFKKLFLLDNLENIIYFYNNLSIEKFYKNKNLTDLSKSIIQVLTIYKKNNKSNKHLILNSYENLLKLICNLFKIEKPKIEIVNNTKPNFFNIQNIYKFINNNENIFIGLSVLTFYYLALKKIRNYFHKDYLTDEKIILNKKITIPIIIKLADQNEIIKNFNKNIEKIINDLSKKEKETILTEGSIIYENQYHIKELKKLKELNEKKLNDNLLKEEKIKISELYLKYIENKYDKNYIEKINKIKNDMNEIDKITEEIYNNFMTIDNIVYDDFLFYNQIKNHTDNYYINFIEDYISNKNLNFYRNLILAINEGTKKIMAEAERNPDEFLQKMKNLNDGDEYK